MRHKEHEDKLVLFVKPLVTLVVKFKLPHLSFYPLQK
jgi:hypothetical protein